MEIKFILFSPAFQTSSSPIHLAVVCIIRKQRPYSEELIVLRFEKGNPRNESGGESKRGRMCVTESVWGYSQIIYRVPKASWEKYVLRFNLKVKEVTYLPPMLNTFQNAFNFTTEASFREKNWAIIVVNKASRIYNLVLKKNESTLKSW